MKKKFLAWLLCAVMVLTIAPMPTALAAEGDVATLMLSNEEGGLIDQLIAAGHGDDSLYEVLQILQPVSGGAIPTDFMAALAASPADCDAKTAVLSDFSDPSNNPIGIGADGNLIVAPIHGRDYYTDTDFTTSTGSVTGVGDVLFTAAESEDDYIDAGAKTYDGSTHYFKAFAVVWSVEAPEATTIVLTNEGSGFLIDQLIAEGHGDDTMYEVMQLLQPMSGGAIPASFMSTLAATPAGSDVKTATLSIFAGLNNPVGINTDGTVMITSIYGNDYDGDEGYTTSQGDQVGIGIAQFTAADSALYYIDTGLVGDGNHYHAFAIVWSVEAPEATTFVLSNEEGGLIDWMITMGYGNSNLYQALVSIAPSSGGVITEDFLETLALCDSGSQIFTQMLNDYAGLNGAIAINTDGTVFTTTTIKGRDHHGETGYSTYPTGATQEIFTYADSAGYYIDAPNGGTTYKVFAIGWSMALTVAGTATDDTAILQIDNKTPSARDKTWEINVTSGTVKAGVAKADVTLSGLPAGLDYTAAKGTGNTIVITLTGAATTALTADATVTATIKGSAVTEADAQDSAGISLKLWYVGPGTTLILTNELGAGYGGLIDKLIDAGHGTKNLYQVTQLLQPYSSGAMTDRFIQTLASNPADSDIFTYPLTTFADIENNPIAVNADGTVHVVSIFGRYYYGVANYTTTTGQHATAGSIFFTTANSEAHFIDVGTGSSSIPGFSYHAFAIVWMPELPTVTTDTVNASGVTQTTAAVSGNVTSAGTASVTERGFVYGTSANPTTADSKITATLGTGTGAFSATLSGLSAGTPYHVRAYATSSAGTSYGEDRTFTTLTGGGGGDPSPVAPTVVTNDASGITASGATLNGNVTASGGATVTERGFVYGSSANPAIGGAGVTKVTVGSGTGSFNTAISGLAASTPYHVRAYAINSAGTSYGLDKGFTTLAGTTPTTPPDDNDPDYIPRTLTDPATGITVSGNLIHKSAALTVGSMALHAEGTCAACDAIRQRMANDDFLMLIGKDISLSYGFQGSLTITIPVGSAYNGDTVTILHCANGTLQTFTATVTDGKATFTVTSLSPFAVFAAADVLDNIPKTGDGGGFPLGLGLSALGMLGFCLLVLTRKRRRA